MPHRMHNAHILVKHHYSPGDFDKSGPNGHTPKMQIDRLRRMRGLTQIELAERAGMSQSTLSRAENGAEGLTLRQYRAIAQALDATLADLFSEGRAEDELRVIDLYRALPEDRRRMWREMALAFASGQTTPSP